MNTQNDQVQMLKQNLAQKLNNIINPSKDVIKKPHNRLWIALLAFNAIFFPLDIATGVTVGFVTRWYYGFFVFFAGFGTMVVHESLYSNPYAKFWQKAISVAGFLTSITVTALIGLSAIVVNVLLVGYNQELYGVVMAGAAFLVLFFHGVLIAVYYFIDHGIIAKQKTTSAIATHEQTLQDFRFAEQIVDKINELEVRLTKRIESGDGIRMGAALNNITGKEWIDERVANPTNGQNH
jgi:hypothetical protein